MRLSEQPEKVELLEALRAELKTIQRNTELSAEEKRVQIDAKRAEIMELVATIGKQV